MLAAVCKRSAAEQIAQPWDVRRSMAEKTSHGLSLFRGARAVRESPGTTRDGQAAESQVPETGAPDGPWRGTCSRFRALYIDARPRSILDPCAYLQRFSFCSSAPDSRSARRPVRTARPALNRTRAIVSVRETD